jgi:hypothetical protein
MKNLRNFADNAAKQSKSIVHTLRISKYSLLYRCHTSIYMRMYVRACVMMMMMYVYVCVCARAHICVHYMYTYILYNKI